MAVLANPKHERFAQEIAKGSTARDAYRSAGYDCKGDAATDANASRLLSQAKVRERVAAIQERAAVRAEISVASITEKLLAIAARAEAKDEAPMLGVARASYMDAAKLNGLISDKLEVNASGELAERLARARGRTG